jgi:hypothetical protein
MNRKTKPYMRFGEQKISEKEHDLALIGAFPLGASFCAGAFPKQ